MSESQYTPTTNEVRMAYGDARCIDADASHDLGCPQDAEFDRWLAAHDAEVRRSQAEADIALLHTHAISLKAGLLSVDQIIQDIRNSVERSAQ